jgi:CDP-diacylglycerol---glycerol-3-phosphate 3-phosphatidyltransferase
MNLPNKLTLLRFGLTAVLALVLQAELPLACTAGLLLFGIASITDYADGAIARSRNLITDFGALMDPLADKILTATGLICLAALNYDGRPAVPAWAAIVIVSRSFSSPDYANSPPPRGWCFPPTGSASTRRSGRSS